MLKEMTGEKKPEVARSAPAKEAASAPAPSAGKTAAAEPLAGDDDSMAEFERLLSGE
jgi:hypothetical protein